VSTADFNGVGRSAEGIARLRKHLINGHCATFGKVPAGAVEDLAAIVWPGGECGEDSEYGRGWDAACRDRAAAIRKEKP